MRKIDLRVPDITEVITISVVYLSEEDGKQYVAQSVITNDNKNVMIYGEPWVVPNRKKDQIEERSADE